MSTGRTCAAAGVGADDAAPIRVEQGTASRRNLHLAKFGLLSAAEDGFEKLPPPEQRKREVSTVR